VRTKINFFQAPVNGGILTSYKSRMYLILFGFLFCFVLRQSLTMQPRLALNSGCSCLYLLSAGITVMYHHGQLQLQMFILGGGSKKGGIWSAYVAQAGLKFIILLLPPPKSWDYSSVQHHAHASVADHLPSAYKALVQFTFPIFIKGITIYVS
jgi:hypothetical protein